jgi:hypothetical protein
MRTCIERRPYHYSPVDGGVGGGGDGDANAVRLARSLKVGKRGVQIVIFSFCEKGKRFSIYANLISGAKNRSVIECLAFGDLMLSVISHFYIQILVCICTVPIKLIHHVH